MPVSFIDRWLLQAVRKITECVGIRVELQSNGVAKPQQLSKRPSIQIADRRILASLLLNPETNFGDSYSEGRLEIKGDIVPVLERLTESVSPSLRWSSRLVSAWLRWIQSNSVQGSRRNVQNHYDLPSDFYGLWLDPQMVYTCAYFPDRTATLEEAQRAKMDLVCQKLWLRPGETVVEAGCGWGALSLYMAKNYGARVKAYNISHEQVCGGWITPSVLEVLRIDPEAYGRTRVLQPITGFKIARTGASGVCVDYGRVVSYGIRRCEFDEYLLRRCGARCREETSVHSIERTADGWIINGEFKTRLLVGAGGHFCPVARYVGTTNLAQAVIAQEMEFEMNATQAASCVIRAETPELYFCSDMRGYGWCFRKPDHLNIGLGRLDSHSIGNYVRKFCRSLKQNGKLCFELPNKFKGHAYFLFGGGRKTLVDDAVILIGDAAGLAYPQSGEGIRPAVESGLLAADTIKTAEGNYSRDRLSIYSVGLNARLARTKGSFEAAAQYLPATLRNACARPLFTNKKFCQRAIDMWFPHNHNDRVVTSIR